MWNISKPKNFNNKIITAIKFQLITGKPIILNFNILNFDNCMVRSQYEIIKLSCRIIREWGNTILINSQIPKKKRFLHTGFRNKLVYRPLSYPCNL